MNSRPTADELKAIRKRLHLTQEELAVRLGISRNRWSRYEYGHSRIPLDLAEKLAALHSEEQTTPSDMTHASLLFGFMSQVPVVGRASAGVGETNVDSDLEPVWVPQSLARLGGIGFRIDGDSMMPALQPGDVAVFRASSTPRRGFTFLVRNPSHEFRCKNLEWRNNEWTLVSLNQSYPDEGLGASQVLGILVGWYRSVGTYEKLEADPHGLRLEPF